MRKIILGSTSPRRREILEKLRIPFVTEDSGYEEDMTLPLKPRDLVKKLALGKARAVAVRHTNAIIIGGDTIVVLGKEVLGKPHTVARAKEMLKKLSGKTHSIMTGLAVIDTKTGKEIVRAVEAKIEFRTLSDKQINSYVETKEPLDKAGAYAVQGYGAALIKKITGDYYGIVGLPLSLLQDELEELGVL
jgi:septum formation protein